MTRVALLVRVSTDKQDYNRQITELQEHCEKMNWEVVRIFANKVSGAKKIEERQELVDMLQYISENDIDKVCVWEISRLGRSTLEALKIIELLNEHKVCLYIKNYNLETLDNDGKINPITSLITTILLEISQMERNTIKERMASGRDQYIAKCRELARRWEDHPPIESLMMQCESNTKRRYHYSNREYPYEISMP